MKQLFILSLILVAFLTPSYGQNNGSAETVRRIDNYLAELYKIGFDGTVLVVIDNEVKISKGYGFSNKEQQIKNSPATIFDIGSITKQFTAAAILKLEMQGKLSTSDPVLKYFDNVPADKKSITIHDLLRHQSGLPSNVGKDYDSINSEEFLNKVWAAPLRFPVGTSFSYSNIGYSLLAMIIEKVSGQSYESYLYENLWKPAKMETTGYTRPAFDKSLIATGYLGNDSVWGKPTDKAWDRTAPYWHLKGNGGILSTTGDLYKWHQALMSDKILSKEAKQKYYHPKIRENETYDEIYAYGWDVSKTNRGTTRVWHTGSNRIFFADFLRYTDEGITLIMYTNQSHPHFNNLNHEIARIIFNKDFKPEIPFEDNEPNRNFTNHIIKTIEDSGLEKAKETYQKREKGVNLLEYLMRDEGFNHIDNQMPDIAIKIFEMNVYAFPNSAKALQGLGEGYMETGKNDLALNYLNQSLKINPDNPFVTRMVKKLSE